MKLKVREPKLEIRSQKSEIRNIRLPSIVFRHAQRAVLIAQCSLFVLLTACTNITPTPIIITPAPPNTKPAAGATISTFATPTTQSLTATPPFPVVIDLPNSTVTNDPFRINFGTQTAIPTLNWRPPPVPVPLSLRPEDHYWFARPIASNAVNWPHPLYRYGSTYFGVMNAHTGVDLDSPMGTPVLAANAGTVVWVGYGLLGTKPAEKDPYGNAVVIKHDFGYNNQSLYTVYAHMSEVNVWLNQPVKMGEQIGLVGSTGFSTGPHLHFEVRIGENRFLKTVNPELWLAPPTGWGVLAGRVLDKSGKYLSEIPIEVMDAKRTRYPIVSYSAQFVNNDPTYKENFVLSDLPAGIYSFKLKINNEDYSGETEILSGQTTFVIVQENVKPIVRNANPAATLGRAPSATFTVTPSKTLTPTFTRTPTRTPQPSATK